MNTIFLHPETWDLIVDANGNIAMAENPYSISQDVASACRLWRGEALFDTTRGVPYKTGVLGQLPPLAMLTEWYKSESELVPEVVKATPVLTFENRQLGGQIQVKLESESFNVNLSN